MYATKQKLAQKSVYSICDRKEKREQIVKKKKTFTASKYFVAYRRNKIYNIFIKIVIV